MKLYLIEIILFSIDRANPSSGSEHPFIPFGIIPYLVDEGPNDLTLSLLVLSDYMDIMSVPNYDNNQ